MDPPPQKKRQEKEGCSASQPPNDHGGVDRALSEGVGADGVRTDGVVTNEAGDDGVGALGPLSNGTGDDWTGANIAGADGPRLNGERDSGAQAEGAVAGGAGASGWTGPTGQGIGRRDLVVTVMGNMGMGNCLCLFYKLISFLYDFRTFNCTYCWHIFRAILR